MLLTLVLAIILVCNLYTIVTRAVTGEQQPAVFGYSTAVVISGSMSGCIEIDDMVIIREQDSYAVGDVVSFKSGDIIVTHRIIAQEDGGFVTKGDANNARDIETLYPEFIVGRVVGVIPGIGKPIEFMRTPFGMMCVVAVGFSLYYVPTLFERKREKGEQTDETEKQYRNKADD